MTITASELKEIRNVMRQSGVKNVSIRDLDSIEISPKAWTRESAVAFARVILSDLGSRKALSQAETLIMAMCKVDREVLRAALRYERKVIRFENGRTMRASERMALAIGRREGKAEARKYNTVGAKRNYTEEERAAYAKLPRYTEEQAREVTRRAIDRETEQQRDTVALDLVSAGWDGSFIKGVWQHV